MSVLPRPPPWALSLVLILMPPMIVGSSSKLNVPRVLLPLADEGSMFTLYSERGCFRWKSSRPESVSIVPLNPTSDGCSSAATVSSTHSATSPHWSKTQEWKPFNKSLTLIILISAIATEVGHFQERYVLISIFVFVEAKFFSN